MPSTSVTSPAVAVIPELATIWLPGLASVTLPPVAASEPTPISGPSAVSVPTGGPACVIAPMACRSNVAATVPRETVPSIVRLAADGVATVAPAGTLVNPPIVSVPRPGEILASNAGSISN